MIRVKITKNYKQYKVGETVEVTPNIAHGLIDGGYGIISKDMVPETDYGVKTRQKTRINIRNK